MFLIFTWENGDEREIKKYAYEKKDIFAGDSLRKSEVNYIQKERGATTCHQRFRPSVTVCILTLKCVQIG